MGNSYSSFSGKPKFTENFNRANGAIGNDWTLTINSNENPGNTTPFVISSNKLITSVTYLDLGILLGQDISRDKEIYNIYPIKVSIIFEITSEGVRNNCGIFIAPNCKTQSGVLLGNYIGIFPYIYPTGAKIVANGTFTGAAGTTGVPYGYTPGIGVHHIEAEFYPGYCRAKTWAASSAKPDTWTAVFNNIISPVDASSTKLIIRNNSSITNGGSGVLSCSINNIEVTQGR